MKAKIPLAYVDFLLERARKIFSTDKAIADAIGAAANATWRMKTPKEQTVPMVEKLRDLLIERGMDIPPIPVGASEWKRHDEESRPPRDEDSEDEKVRRNMIRFRQDLGWDQIQASDRTGVAYDVLVAWERGDRTPSGTELIKLAPHYGRRVEDFVRVGDIGPPDGGLMPAIWIRHSPSVPLNDEGNRRLAEIKAQVEQLNDPKFRAEKKAQNAHILKARGKGK